MMQRLFDGERAGRFHHGFRAFAQAEHAGFKLFLVQALGGVLRHGYGFNAELAKAFRQQRSGRFIQSHERGAGCGFPWGKGGGDGLSRKLYP